MLPSMPAARSRMSGRVRLADLLQNSEIHPLDAGHFAWEQASDEYGRLIVEWVTGGFQRLGGAVTA